MIPNGVPGDLEQDSRMKVKNGSAMKPNIFTPIPEPRSASPESPEAVPTRLVGAIVGVGAT
jgi:hypothetical protein